MKRLIDKYNNEFIKDGKRLWCTAIDIPFSEIPEDCDFSEYDVNIVNVLYDDCYIRVCKFDKYRNSIIIKIPKYIKELFYLSYYQGLDRCVELLHKLKFEEKLVKNKQKIPYANTIV